jgi:hypothetical protein
VHHMITSLRVGRRMKKLRGVGGVGLRSTGCRSCRSSAATWVMKGQIPHILVISEQRSTAVFRGMKHQVQGLHEVQGLLNSERRHDVRTHHDTEDCEQHSRKPEDGGCRAQHHQRAHTHSCGCRVAPVQCRLPSAVLHMLAHGSTNTGHLAGTGLNIKNQCQGHREPTQIVQKSMPPYCEQ